MFITPRTPHYWGRRTAWPMLWCEGRTFRIPNIPGSPLITSTVACLAAVSALHAMEPVLRLDWTDRKGRNEGMEEVNL